MKRRSCWLLTGHFNRNLKILCLFRSSFRVLARAGVSSSWEGWDFDRVCANLGKPPQNTPYPVAAPSESRHFSVQVSLPKTPLAR